VSETTARITLTRLVGSQVRELLEERQGVATEYQRLKALRPDWDATTG
jgi:hypothetical protein